MDGLAARLLAVSSRELSRAGADQRAEVDRQRVVFRGGRPLPRLEGRTVIVIDDGMASGLTARAALQVVARARPARTILAVPVTGPETAALMLGLADDVVCVGAPPDFVVVNDWYADFDDCPDAAVLKALKEIAGASRNGALKRSSNTYRTAPAEPGASEIQIETTEGLINGSLDLPRGARGVALFAHGGGSSRRSPRSRVVAKRLGQEGLATLRIDLLTARERRIEAKTKHLRFNVGLLAERVLAATRWLAENPSTRGLPRAYFGASTGASAMLAVAARQPGLVAAIVSRGGRTDLAEPLLPRVLAPTLLLAGERDETVLRLNRRALEQLGSQEKKMIEIEGATHLFEYPGSMERVAQLTSEWFSQHL